MTPIERVQRRASAAALLNVPLYATSDMLRREWKRRAFLAHPDRNGGDEGDFRELQDAFELLLETAPEDAAPEPRPASGGIRPKRVMSRALSQALRPA